MLTDISISIIQYYNYTGKVTGTRKLLLLANEGIIADYIQKIDTYMIASLFFKYFGIERIVFRSFPGYSNLKHEQLKF